MPKPLNENIQHVRIENEQGDLLPIMDAAGAKFSELVNAVTANNKAGFNKFKTPNLGEAFAHFTGNELVNAHSAMADVMACRDVYFAIKGAQQ